MAWRFQNPRAWEAPQMFCHGQFTQYQFKAEILVATDATKSADLHVDLDVKLPDISRVTVSAISVECDRWLHLLKINFGT